MKNDKNRCPQCHRTFPADTRALSRVDDTTYICSNCGQKEAGLWLGIVELVARIKGIGTDALRAMPESRRETEVYVPAREELRRARFTPDSGVISSS
jgi:DNA-directed RNA polymerase subunit RPC12/RpoP